MQTLQPKKACGVDGILKEMIKQTDHKFQLATIKLTSSALAFPTIFGTMDGSPQSTKVETYLNPKSTGGMRQQHPWENPLHYH